MRQIPHPLRLIVLVALAGAALAGLSACGGAASASASRPQSPPGTITGTPNVPGDGPVATAIMLDRTPLLKGNPNIENGYVQAALRFALPTVTRGGSLVVEAFGRLSGHPLTLLTANLPTLAQAGPAVRDDAGPMRVLESALRVATGLDPPPTPAIAAALAALTSSAGSDIARGVGVGVAEAATAASSQRDVLVETDGWAFEAGHFDLARSLAVAHTPAKVAATLAGLARREIPVGAQVSLLWMVGLGYTGGQPDPTPSTLDTLTTTWRAVCPGLPVTTPCDVTSEF